MSELGGVHLGGPSCSAAEAGGVGGCVLIDYREIVRL